MVRLLEFRLMSRMDNFVNGGVETLEAAEEREKSLLLRGGEGAKFVGAGRERSLLKIAEFMMYGY